ncbi:MAG: hypothetical protein L0271_00350 [Gemmatimonadetes bacterium]|nr:hypothetical protein [Gemmatimonadota bacterium]
MDSHEPGDGEGFHAMGISIHALYEDPVSPEHDVEAAWNVTRRRVASVPVLLFSPFGFGLSFARWRIELESPVTVDVDGGGELTASTLYIGDRPGTGRTTLFVPAEVQPEDWRALCTDPVTGESKELIVPVRRDTPVEIRRLNAVR